MGTLALHSSRAPGPPSSTPTPSCPPITGLTAACGCSQDGPILIQLMLFLELAEAGNAFRLSQAWGSFGLAALPERLGKCPP